jgi:hypothetical protein
MKKLVLLVSSALFLVPSAAGAEIMVTASLEWLADHSIDSAIYTVTALQEREGLIDAYTITLERTETLRGHPVKTTRVLYQRVPRGKGVNPAPVVEKGDEFLMCFQHYRTGEKRPVQVINLDRPLNRGFKYVAVNKDLKVLQNKADILEVFRARLADHPIGEPMVIDDYSRDNRFELQPYTEVYSAIYGGSACYLLVPDDLVEEVKRRSRQLEEEAIKELQKGQKNAR